MPAGALLLTQGELRDIHAKTAHGLIRGPSRYPIAAVINPKSAGQDAGEVVDGHRRGIPILTSVRQALDSLPVAPGFCVVGVATAGGVLPAEIRAGLLDAAAAGLTLVNGLHQPLAADSEMASLCRLHGGDIIDIRHLRPPATARFWSGEVLHLQVPRIAVLGTDCAVGKRTTCWMLKDALDRLGLSTEIIYTGQTGWLQGLRHGFILDATVNDFVSGELEGAILDCARECQPQVMLIEGQSSLRNPSGPCGSELLLSGACTAAILQHAPGRTYFEGMQHLGRHIPPLEEEIDLVTRLGTQVWGITLNDVGLTPAAAAAWRRQFEDQLGMPVALPLLEGVGDLAQLVASRLSGGKGAR